MYRSTNFLYGLPVNDIDSIAAGAISLSEADRVRLVYEYITSTTTDSGGLGVAPGAEQWSRVTSIMAIHDQEFNERWLKAWSTHGVESVDLDKVKDHVSHSPDFPISISNGLWALVWRGSWIIFPLSCNLHKSPHCYLRTRRWILVIWGVLLPLLFRRSHLVGYHFRGVLEDCRAQDFRPVGNLRCLPGREAPTRLHR